MRPRKLLVVCDCDPVNQSVLKIVLETRGSFSVLKASCPQEAFELMRNLPITVILVNLYLASSCELAKTCKRDCPDTKVIVYSSQWWREHEIQTIADCFIKGSLTAPGPLVQAVRIQANRKRGPKPVVFPLASENILQTA